MVNRMQLIADKIKSKLQDNPDVLKKIEHYSSFSILKNITSDDINTCLHFLLKTACEQNLLKETHDLLELNLFQDINSPLEFEKQKYDRIVILKNEDLPRPSERQKGTIYIKKTGANKAEVCILDEEKTLTAKQYSALEKDGWFDNKNLEINELEVVSNITSICGYTHKFNNNGKTLLGIAAFHGHHELVSYLVEVRMANVNARDINGDTPLHQVVYGDSHPFNHSSYGVSHDRVAKYLLRYDGDLSVTNYLHDTPYDYTKWCAPLKFEDMVGRRFITNTGSASYYADKVRPIFEKELGQQKRYQHLSVIGIGERQAMNFDQFCLEHAIQEYVKDKKATFGYSSNEELYKALDALSEKEWKQMRMLIQSQSPGPYSFKYGPIYNQLSKIGKQSVSLGVAATLLTYYETQSVILSVGAGAITAYMAWLYLTEVAINQKINVRSIKKERVKELQQHDRFFKAPQILKLTQEQLKQIQDLKNDLRGPLNIKLG